MARKTPERRSALDHLSPPEAATVLQQLLASHPDLVLDEALEPFIEDMTRLLKVGLEEDALHTVQGILLGLYRLREEKTNDVLGWAGSGRSTTEISCFGCGSCSHCA